MTAKVVPIKPAYVTGVQPSMSRSNLLLECSYWIGRQGDSYEAEEPARYGSTWHGIASDCLSKGITRPKPSFVKASVAKWAPKYGVTSCEVELYEHIMAALPELGQWLGGANEWRTQFDLSDAYVEVAFALKPGEYGRQIDVFDDDHRYHRLRPGEIPGTVDLACRAKKKVPLLVLDHKTGEEDFSRPLSKPQLLSLAAVVMRATGQEECIVAAFHARRRGMAKVYSDKVKLRELRQYEGRLAAALAKAGDGSMRPTELCKWCPARGGCPAQDADLLHKAGDVLTGLTVGAGMLSKKGLAANDLVVVPKMEMTRERQLGYLYSVVRKAEAIAARAREEIRKEVLASNGTLIPVTPEHEYLVIREYTRENLSKSSIIEAYGQREGEKRLARLRADGALSKTDVVALYPEKERGR